MNFLALVGKEMRLLTRNVVFYLLVAVIVLFYGANYATSESWDAGKAPVPPQKQAERAAAPTTASPAGSPGGATPAGAAGSSAASPAAATSAKASSASAASTTPAVHGATAAPAGSAAPAAPAVQSTPAYGWKEVTDAGEMAKRYMWSMEADLERGWTHQRIVFGMFAGKKKLSETDRKHLQTTIALLQAMQQDSAKHTALEVRQIAAKLDRKLGGSTDYKWGGITFTREINTYEEAMEQYRVKEAEYRTRVEKGQLYPGMARLFCDYVGLTAGLFPVFLAAFALSRDRASRMNELIASRRVKAWTYVGARYLAHAILISLVYLVLSVVAAWQTVSALAGTDELWKALPVFLAYGAGWLLPTVWAAIAFGMLVYTLFGSGIAAIPLQMLWWFVSVSPLSGDYRLFKLYLRYNTAEDADTYRRYAGQILTNRLCYTGLALLMAGAAAFLWERRRSSDGSAKRRFRLPGSRRPKSAEGSL